MGIDDILSPADLSGGDVADVPSAASFGTPLPLNALPTVPNAAALPGAGGGSVSSGDPRIARLRQILHFALPAIAAAYALKQGTGLGSFAGGYEAGEAQRQKAKNEDEQRSLQKDSINRQIANEAYRRAHELRIEAADHDRTVAEMQRQQAADKVAADAKVNTALKSALDEAAQNPSFMDKVNDNGPEKFSLQVAGGGPMNLAEGFARLGVIKGPDGKYAYGKPDSADLVPVPGAGGKPVYGRKKEGAAVYEKPPEKKEPTSHYQLQPEIDAETGKPTGRFFSFDTASNTWHTVEGEGPTATKAAPGAAQRSVRDEGKVAATAALDRLDAHITEADKRGLLGPLKGRTFGELLAGKVGTTGNPEDDYLIGQLKAGLKAGPILTDAGVGGARAAASPQLAKMWGDLLNMHISKEGLSGAISEMRNIVGKAGTNSGKRILYDGDGNPLPVAK